MVRPGNLLSMWPVVVVFAAQIQASAAERSDLAGVVAPGFPGVNSDSIEPGVWSIAGAAWALQVTECPTEELQDQLKKTPATESRGGLGLEHVALFDALRSQFQPLGRRGRVSSFGLDTGQLKVRLYCYRQGQTEVPLGAYIAYPRGKKGWTLLTATPAKTVARPKDNDASLMPLPQGFRRICSRRSDDGTLQCDVISVPYSPEKMARFWGQQGWSMRQPEWAKLNESQWLCYRDDRCIQISSRPSAGGKGTSYVMVSSRAAGRPED